MSPDEHESDGEHTTHADADEHVIAATRTWLERAVIGLKLCPFAEGAYHRGQIRFRVSAQRSIAGLSEELAQELKHLAAADPLVCETSLLIHPYVLDDFGEYNDFLDEADAAVVALGLEGELQVASFHPAYQFAGTEPDEIHNFTNRSPYPMLHLLREASVTRAVDTFPNVHGIGDRNMAVLKALGHAGWLSLWSGGQP